MQSLFRDRRYLKTSECTVQRTLFVSQLVMAIYRHLPPPVSTVLSLDLISSFRIWPHCLEASKALYSLSNHSRDPKEAYKDWKLVKDEITSSGHFPIWPKADPSESMYLHSRSSRKTFNRSMIRGTKPRPLGPTFVHIIPVILNGLIWTKGCLIRAIARLRPPSYQMGR